MRGDVELVGTGLRRAVDILGDGQLWYVVVTPTSAEVAVPYENRPDMAETRIVVDRACSTISRLLSELAGKEYQSTREEDIVDEGGQG